MIIIAMRSFLGTAVFCLAGMIAQLTAASVVSGTALQAQASHPKKGASDKSLEAPSGLVSTAEKVRMYQAAIDTTTSPTWCEYVADQYAEAVLMTGLSPRSLGPRTGMADSAARGEARALDRCVDRFPVATTRGDTLFDLAKLALHARRDSVAAQALAQRLTEEKPADTVARAQVLQRTVKIYIDAAITVDTIAARQAVIQAALRALDSMGPAALASRLTAHALVLPGVPKSMLVAQAPGLVAAALAVLRNDTTRTTRRAAMDVLTAVSTAYLECDSAAAAVVVPRQALADLADAPVPLEYPLEQSLRTLEANDARIGQPGGPLPIDVWLNVPANQLPMRLVDSTNQGSPMYEVKGQIAVLVFSSPNCGPCRAAYPVMQRLAERYATRGVRVVILTPTEGQFAGTMLTVPDEVKNDQAYFAGYYRLTIPVGIDTVGVRRLAREWGQYAIDATPTFMIVDAHGIVQTRLVGWAFRREGELERILNRLLNVSGGA